MKKFYSLSIFLALFFSVLLAGNLEAATYYIDGSNGNDSNPGTLTLPWKTINKANSTLVAGDTVYIRSGIYSSQQIIPSNSGTSGNYITYQNYNGEGVTLSGHPVALYLYGNDYIKIDGLRMQNCRKYFVLLGGANYNIIQNCTFYNAESYWGAALCKWYVNPDTGHWDWRTTPLDIPNNYNQILNNTFEDAPDMCDDGPDQDCGTAPSDSLRIFCGAYNLIQGNVFGNTAHTGLVLANKMTENNVVRANMFQNTYRRGLELYVYARQNLVEGNVFYDHGLNWQDNPDELERNRDVCNPPAIQCIKASHYQIYRKNICDNNGQVFAHDGLYNYFYHNTANKQIRTVSSGGGNWNGYGDYKYNKFKNNIFANTHSLGRSDDTLYLSNWHTYVQQGYTASNNVITHNAFSGTSLNWRWKWPMKSYEDWENSTSQIYRNMLHTPNFTDPANRDFTLQRDSQLIDAGDWLTTITSSTGSGIYSFTVDDTGYFYDGWGIPGQIGDVIKTANGKVTTITKIDYDRNRITVSPAIDIVNGEGLSLNYSGSAPDIGAHEYGSALAPPAGLRLLSGN